MRMKLLLFGLMLLVGVARLCLFTVDRTEFVYVTQLGEHVATHDGSVDEQAGLHFRLPWPIQTLTRIDRRLQVLELPAAELVTEDPSEAGTIDKTLAIDAYVVWRIPDAAACERFILTVGTAEQARAILRDRFRGKLGAAIARTKFADLISAEPGHVDEHREDLRKQLLAGTTGESPDGIDIIDVRIRRLNYPPQVRQAIFDRIISERKRKAAVYQSRGQQEAENIKSASQAKISVEEAEARARNEEKRGTADAQADAILNQAISKDPDYYAELRKRELGELALKDGRKKVWSTTLFRLFFPAMEERKPKSDGLPEKEGGR
jgi:membrane protease subunit HflC